jgi:hypothetical protein
MTQKTIDCPHCGYQWLSNPKRPDPRFITCPNCRENIELRGSKLE